MFFFISNYKLPESKDFELSEKESGSRFRPWNSAGVKKIFSTYNYFSMLNKISLLMNFNSVTFIAV